MLQSDNSYVWIVAPFSITERNTIYRHRILMGVQQVFTYIRTTCRQHSLNSFLFL